MQMPLDDFFGIGVVEHTERPLLLKEAVNKAVQRALQRNRKLLRKGSEEQFGEQDKLVLHQRHGDFP